MLHLTKRAATTLTEYVSQTKWGAKLKQIEVQEVPDLRSLTKGHVAYFFTDQEQYVSNVVDYVIAGLRQNECTIIVESDRMAPMIVLKLAQKLTAPELDQVRFLNNYEFYYAHGDFRINSIPDLLPTLFKGEFDPDMCYRTWAHIEWRDESEVSKLLHSEEQADIIVAEENLLSVCAYDSRRVSGDFRDRLLASHSIHLHDKA